jgi:hypothetical protein
MLAKSNKGVSRLAIQGRLFLLFLILFAVIIPLAAKHAEQLSTTRHAQVDFRS